MQHVTTIKIGGNFEEIIGSFNDKSGQWSVSKFSLFEFDSWVLRAWVNIFGTGQGSWVVSQYSTE